MFGMDSSHMTILDYQRRSLFSVVLSSTIPFCISDYFITNNKDAMRRINIKGVNQISSHPCPSHLESSLNKNKNNNKIIILITIVPSLMADLFLFLFVHTFLSSAVIIDKFNWFIIRW
jgi:hypothetical protein